MQRLLLTSITEEENYILQRKLEPLMTELGHIHFVSVRPQGLLATVDQSMTMVVLNTAFLTQATRQTVGDLRGMGYLGPILLIAKADNPDTIRDVVAADNVVLLEKPFAPKDLLGIVRKMILSRRVAQRFHRRYNTVQKAEVEFSSSGARAESTLLNLSKGGAYCEFPSTAPVRVGELLRVSIPLAEVNRTYAMPAKVIWTTPMGPAGGHGVGIEFIGRGEMQKTANG